MPTLHLSCAADRAYVPQSAAMIHSVLAARGGLDARVHYLHGPSFPRAMGLRLEEMVEAQGGAIDFLEVADERVEGLPMTGDITATMWLRIFLPELLPDIERVLYLDCDTLALDALEPLWLTNLGDHLVAAVTNVFTPEPAARSRPAALGLTPEAYFNSGVLLMNLEEMRRDGTTGKLRDYALSHHLMYPDQDTLNAVMGQRRLALHPRWNCMNSLVRFDWAEEVFDERTLDEARRNPAIRHFEGPMWNKPWRRDCDFEHRELYLEHRRGTPWPRVRLEGPSLRERFDRLRRSVSA